MDSMEELCLCYYDILHAMHAQFRNMAPLHFAANSFSKARKDYSVIPLESAEDMEDPVSFEEQVEYRLLAEEFMNSLSQKDRQILDVKMKGIRGKDAARAAGVGSEACVSRRFSGIRQAYYRQDKGVSANA